MNLSGVALIVVLNFFEDSIFIALANVSNSDRTIWLFLLIFGQMEMDAQWHSELTSYSVSVCCHFKGFSRCSSLNANVFVVLLTGI